MGRNHMEGDEGSQSPERREPLHINSIVIPADDDQRLDQRQIKAASVADYWEVVGGYIEGVDLLRPPARMYVNEEGKIRQMPMNRRATMLLWMHNSDFRYGDIIAGDALLVGPVGRNDQDTTVPEEYTRALFEAHSFHIEVQPQGSQEWRRAFEPFDNWYEAYGFALGRAIGPDDRQWPTVADIRVVPGP